MGKPILMLRLEGPLQSWGDKARWDVRDTNYEPTKSGVLGLVGAAMGLGRRDETLLELDALLRFGVRVEHAGRKITDYQTVTNFLPTAAGAYKLGGSKTVSTLEAARKSGSPATVISPRDYIEDGAFLVGLEAKSGGESLLERAAAAVQAPRWPLFLGRKACVPSRPVFEFFGDNYTNLEDAFNHYDWEWLGALEIGDNDEVQSARERSKPKASLMAWVETDDLFHPKAVSRQDALRLNSARLYDFRGAIEIEPCLPSNLLIPKIQGDTP